MSPIVSFCYLTLDASTCCTSIQDSEIRDTIKPMFIEVPPKEVREPWEQWFCFGCLPSQPRMTKVTAYDDGDNANQTSGEMYLCEDFAKELYGEELDKPSTKYDDYGIWMEANTEGSFELWGDGEKAEEWQFQTDVEIIEDLKPIIPSMYFKDANDFFSYDQFRPPWMRGDDGQDLEVVIVNADWEAEQERYKTEKGSYYECFRRVAGSEQGIQVAILASAVALSSYLF